MITFEMFGSDIIKVIIKGFLKNITDNQNIDITAKGIKNKNKIVYSFNDVKHTIKINNNELIFIRENDEFLNTFVFGKKSISNYLLKEKNFDIDIDINTLKLEILDEYIYVKYEVIDSKCIYEYKIEMSEIL